MSTDWNTATREILDRLDLRAEYASLGVDITSKRLTVKGWLQCRAVGKEDKHPSAGINVSGEHPTLGRYREFTGEARNLSFFEAAAAFGNHADWQAARRHYAKAVGVELPTGKPPRQPDQELAWRDYNAAVVRLWAAKHKRGVTEPSFRAAGGRLAGYPRKTSATNVLCLPVYGPHLLDGGAVNWWACAQHGGDIPLWQGPTEPPRPVKSMCQAEMPPGWIGAWGLRHLETAEVVWKVEGPPDMLALQAAIPRELNQSHVVITNSNGTMHVLDEQHLAPLAGKTVYVCHDADKDGQAGAERWCDALVRVAATVRNVQLPYEVVGNHGKDLRDWLMEEV